MAISLLIVGHANTGKTSLIRTMVRDHTFGKVQNQSGTTRHVERITLSLADQPLLHLVDTPGFEDSMGLWQTRTSEPFVQLSNEQWLNAICEDPNYQVEYEQELKILRQLNQCDVILYVIDLRQKPLGKYLDELNILACANKPIVPILNYCHEDAAHRAAWKQCLAERHLHAHVQYDTVAFYLADERKLYQTLQSLMPDHYEALQDFMTQRERDASHRLTKATEQLTKLLIECATTQKICRSKTPSALEKTTFEQSIRQREQRFVEFCLHLYAFQASDVILQDLPLEEGAWQQDVFDADTLKHWGIQTSTKAVTGAAIGAGIDVLSAGLTLGTATTLGAMIGAGLQTGYTFKSALLNKLKGQSVLALQPASCIVLMWRGIELVRHLHHRGHAAQVAYQGNMTKKTEPDELARLERLFQKLSQRIEWHGIETLPPHELVNQLRETLDQSLKD